MVPLFDIEKKEQVCLVLFHFVWGSGEELSFVPFNLSYFYILAENPVKLTIQSEKDQKRED